MWRDAKRLCRRYGPTYVETANLRLPGRRCGKGFAYVDSEGRTVRNKALKTRMRRLAIPPAWTEVCIAEDARAHFQAVGRDAEGRSRYRYHPDWEQARADAKTPPIAASWFGALTSAQCREERFNSAGPNETQGYCGGGAVDRSYSPATRP